YGQPDPDHDEPGEGKAVWRGRTQRRHPTRHQPAEGDRARERQGDDQTRTTVAARPGPTPPPNPDVQASFEGEPAEDREPEGRGQRAHVSHRSRYGLAAAVHL